MTATSEFSWTEEAVAELRRLYAAGRSDLQIAIAIGAPTRNVVIGKRTRLKLSRDGTAPASHPAAPKAPRAQPSPPRSVPQPVVFVEREAPEPTRTTGPGVRFLDRGLFQCAMPQPGWDQAPVDEKMVCGAPVELCTSWCRHCLKLVTVPGRLQDVRHKSFLRGVAA